MSVPSMMVVQNHKIPPAEDSGFVLVIGFLLVLSGRDYIISSSSSADEDEEINIACRTDSIIIDDGAHMMMNLRDNMMWTAPRRN